MACDETVRLTNRVGEGPIRASRRDVMKWVAVAAAAAPVMKRHADGGKFASNTIGFDPDLMNPTVPWDRTLNQDQLRTVKALCDLIIPEDERSLSAGAVGVPAFIDEWISAPYPDQQRDRQAILYGLGWLDEKARVRFAKAIAELDESQMRAICDPIRYTPDAAESDRRAAFFFSRFRDICMLAFYTTPQGMNDLQYIGNVPIAEFPGPPQEVLKHLGLA